MPDPDDELDGCELDFASEAMPDDESDLFVLFADAIDPATAATVGGVESEWKELFGAGPRAG